MLPLRSRCACFVLFSWIFFGICWKCCTVAAEETTIQIIAIVNRTLELPCDINSPIVDDKTIIILWYRDNSGNPIFSLDLRGRQGGGGRRKRDANEDLLNRTFFRPNQKSPAYLTIKNIQVADEGIYRCRVDFRTSPTRNSNVNVTVIVPPQRPTIMDEKGLELSSVVGPYNEGSSLILSCESGGGKPPPAVSWWRDDECVDDSYEVTSVGIVRNDLLVPSLNRDDFHAIYRCEAANNNITEPILTEVTVDMNLKPLEVRILQEKIPLSAKTPYLLVCQSSGSRPLPIMAWWLGNTRMKDAGTNKTQDGNVTISTLNFTPSSEDNGKHLSCRAENPTIPQSGMEDGWKLDIHYAPIMSLKLGSSLREDNIKEGIDVYFECVIRANPWTHKVEWKFQDEYIFSDPNAGIIISNQSLVIPKVRKAKAGLYTCIGVNTEGSGESQPIDLQVKHIPICKEGQQTTYGIARNEPAKIVCEVDANPKEVSFNWTFNRTSEGGEFSKNQISTELAKSTLLYTPRNEKDYGFLYCFGRNEMGVQLVPCVFHLVAAGPPDPVHNCTVLNKTETALFVRCHAGYNGGLEQAFVLDLYDATGREIKSTIKHSKPEFHLNGLQAGMSFVIEIYASNAKGKSEALPLSASTKEAPPQPPDSDSIFAITPILGVLIGIVAAFTLVAIAIVIVMKFRASHISKRKEYEQEPMDRSNVPLRKDTDDGGENEEKSPDVIPSNNDHEFPPVEVKCLQKYNSSGTLERKCDNCRTVPPYGGLQPEQIINHSWSQSKKVRPYEEMQYIEMQTPNNQRKMPPAAPVRRDSEAHLMHCSTERGYPVARRPFGAEEEDVSGVETPLMKNPHETIIIAPLRRSEPETTAF